MRSPRLLRKPAPPGRSARYSCSCVDSLSAWATSSLCCAQLTPTNTGQVDLFTPLLKQVRRALYGNDNQGHGLAAAGIARPMMADFATFDKFGCFGRDQPVGTLGTAGGQRKTT